MTKIMTLAKGLPRGTGIVVAASGALMLGALSVSPLRADGLPNPLAGFMQPDNNSDNAIDYRPRPALVVPPTSDLPSPQSSSVTRTVNWPKDPDLDAARAAKADSRRPAPTSDSQVPGGTANEAVFVRDEGPNCDPLLGMQIMCFKAPWGSDVQLPGATQSKEPKGVVLKTQKRKYLIDPPEQYLAAVPMQPASGNATDAAAAALPPKPDCSWPGWFGCPDYSAYYAKQAPNAQAAAAPSGQPGQPQPQPQRQCMFPGYFGCPAQQPQTQSVQYSQGASPNAQAVAGPPAPGQAAQPAQKKCALPGWFGCPEQ